MQLFRTLIPTPLGDMLALSSDEGLCALEFTTVKGRASGEERLSRLKARLARWFPPHQLVDGETPIIARTRAWLEALLRRHRAPRSAICRSTCAARRSSRRVWIALQAIPPGQTTSYGAIAKALDAPGASRAVGAANGANPDRDHRPLPSRDRIERIADRLRRRPRSQDVADRSRAPLADRAAGVAVLTTKTRRTRRRHEETTKNAQETWFLLRGLRVLRVFVCRYSYLSARIGSTLVARLAGM